MVAKAEKSYEMVHGQILNIFTMGNQQESSEQENPQRLEKLILVEYKLLVLEVVCPTRVGEDIVCALSKDKGYVLCRTNVAVCLNITVFSIVIPGDQE